MHRTRASRLTITLVVVAGVITTPAAADVLCKHGKASHVHTA